MPVARTTVALILAVLAGAALAYPSFADWVGALARSAAVTHYGETTDALTAEQREGLLREAERYNKTLTDSPLSDPFSPASGPAIGSEAAQRLYSHQLSLDGDSTGAIARLRYAKIGVDLPIFHGTDEAALSRGVGHLYGSALPVGGLGTHAVLTAHNGFTGAQMFDDLDHASMGDIFTVTVAGRTLEYRVDKITVIAPDHLEPLLQVPGQDFVTLVACAPRFINSDRLLVRGQRIGTSYDQPRQGDILPAQSAAPPWWVFIFLAPIVVSGALLLFLQPGSTRRSWTRWARRNPIRFAPLTFCDASSRAAMRPVAPSEPCVSVARSGETNARSSARSRDGAVGPFQ